MGMLVWPIVPTRLRGRLTKLVTMAHLRILLLKAPASGQRRRRKCCRVPPPQLLVKTRLSVKLDKKPRIVQGYL